MAKYSGLFLSFLLVLFCLWINIFRYPAVWTMVNGGMGENDSAVKVDSSAKPPKGEGSKARGGSDGKAATNDSEESLLTKEERGAGEDRSSAGEKSSDDLYSARRPSSRALEPVPIPALPVSDEGGEVSDRFHHSSDGSSREDRNARYFRPATLSNPVENDSDADPSEKEDSSVEETGADSDNIKETSVDSTEKDEKNVVYRSVGAEGTSPMNLDSPSYAAALSSRGETEADATQNFRLTAAQR